MIEHEEEESPDDDSGVDMSFATTHEIFMELKKRYRTVVLAAVTDCAEEQDRYYVNFAGSATECVGLARLLSNRTNRYLIDGLDDE